MTCLYLASKTENHYMSLDKYCTKLKTEKSVLMDCEYVVMEGLRFHLAVYHPYIALHGIFLDAQTFMQNQIELMQKIYDKAIQWTYVGLKRSLSTCSLFFHRNRSFFSDCLFLYQVCTTSVRMHPFLIPSHLKLHWPCLYWAQKN
jgi:hypothetical protein